jgi:PAS domain S-box-containing protein
MTDLGIAAKLQAAFELSPTILAVTSLDDGRILEVNDAFLRATGYARDEIIGRPIPELGLWMNPEMREQGLAHLRQGRPVRDMEARFRTKYGEELIAIASADLIVIDGRSCVLTALVDITARQRAERALRETERRFAEAFHANPLPMSITRLVDGHHLDVNEAALRHSGYTRDEMLGRTKAELGFFEVTFRTKGGEDAQARGCKGPRRHGRPPAAKLRLGRHMPDTPFLVSNVSGMIPTPCHHGCLSSWVGS